MKVVFASLLIVAATFLSNALVASAQTGCMAYPSGSTPPTGYGASWNQFTSTRDLLIRLVECTGTTAEFFAGMPIGITNPSLYAVWEKGYRYTTTGWQPFALSPASDSAASSTVSGQWIIGRGGATLTNLSSPTYLVGYVCYLQNNVWKCGCRTTSCTTNHWQLQAFTNGTTPGDSDGDGDSGGGSPVNTLQQQYPNLYNENLPYNGLFYGLPFSADNFELARIGNRQEDGQDLTLRFRAERSGSVSYIVYNNRFDPDGNGYSTGNGGRIHAELRNDDGTARHMPVATALTKTNSHTPGDSPSMMKLTFQTPVSVQAGKLYHIVFIQESGAYASTNGGGIFEPTDPVGGPYYGNDFLMFHGIDGVWKTASSDFGKKNPDIKHGQSYVSVGYSDNIEVGMGGWSLANNYPRIGGSNRIRELFTVDGPTRKVDGVWFRMTRKKGNTTPLTIEIKNASGTTLLTKSVPPGNITEGVIPYNLLDFSTQDSLRWTYVDFGTTIPLVSGAQYAMEMSSPSSPADGYMIHALLDTAIRGYNNDRNMWKSGKAEMSRDGGASWHTRGWTPGLEDNETDYGFGFTLEGGPRSIRGISTWAATQ